MADETTPNTPEPAQPEPEQPEPEQPELAVPEEAAPHEAQAALEEAAAPSDGSPEPDSPASAPVDDDALGEAESGLDPQLIALCVVLWVVALSIFAFRWTDMRVDYYLGNLRETLQAQGRLDEDAVAALVDMADDGVLDHLIAELNDPALRDGAHQQSDGMYRVAVLRVIGELPGPAAHNVLFQATGEGDPNLRANAYALLAERAQALEPPQRAATLDLLRQAAEGDPSRFSRVHAARHLARLGGVDDAWPLVRSLRDLDAEILPVLGPPLLATLREVSGLSEEQLPHDPLVAPSDEQLRSWEVWFRDAGGTIPAGESLDEVRARERAEAQQSAGPPEGSQPGGVAEAGGGS